MLKLSKITVRPKEIVFQWKNSLFYFCKNNSWEQRKCGDMTVELSEYDNLQSGYPLLTSSRSGLMFQNDFRDKTSTDNQETLFSVVPYGKCTYRHMSDDNIFHFNINIITEKGLVSREYPVFDASENNNLSFLVQYLNSSPEFTKFCAERKLGGTRTRLYYKNLCEFTLYVPNKNEQDKIAEYLESLDNFITLHQRERIYIELEVHYVRSSKKYRFIC